MQRIAIYIVNSTNTIVVFSQKIYMSFSIVVTESKDVHFDIQFCDSNFKRIYLDKFFVFLRNKKYTVIINLKVAEFTYAAPPPKNTLTVQNFY